MTFEDYNKYWKNNKVRSYIDRTAITSNRWGETWWLPVADPNIKEHNLITVDTRGKMYLHTEKCDRDYIKPLLFEPKASFSVGQMFTFGRDLFELPLRWVAIDRHTLVVVEPLDIVNRFLTLQYEDIETANAFKTSFSTQEIRDIENGNIMKHLVPFDGVIKASSDVRRIPERRYIKDNTIKKIVFDTKNRKKPLSIGEHAFAGSSLSCIESLPKCEYIGVGAFSETNLCSLTLENVDIIDKYAFFYAPKIKDLYINGTINKINDKAFASNSIEQIKFGDNAYILELGYGAFADNYIDSDTEEDVLKRVIVQYDVDAFIEQKSV